MDNILTNDYNMATLVFKKFIIQANIYLLG